MTATDELRALLDERGIEWMDDSYAQLWCTVWHGQDGKQWRMTENRSGMLTELKAWQTTPEQAIAATLGRGTCKRLWTGSEMICSECAHQLNDPTANFCPTCGRRVIDAEEVDG